MSATSDLRIVLVGMIAAGKTEVINTILRASKENETPASETRVDVYSETHKCEMKNVQIGGQNVAIVDTPGLCHADKDDNTVMEEIKQSVVHASPGPHVFLFVLKLECFDEGAEAVKWFWNTFGQKAEKYTMVLFTHGKELEKMDKGIDVFIRENKELHEFLCKCHNRYYVIENKNQDPSQVAKLLSHINTMVEENGKKDFYNRKMLEAVEKRPGIKRKIALSVNGSAVAGAGLGAATTYLVGSSLGIPIGAAAGAAAGGVMGGVGIVASHYIKKKQCVIQ